MANTFGQSTANDTGDWNSNKEMNPAANSSVTEDGLLERENKDGDETWRDAEPHVEKSETGSDVNPGRTPGKAEGVEDPERTGNR
jgi:hypothetical protein